ncbi:hypothetical protein, partial [Klebsiella pneumoniae]
FFCMYKLKGLGIISIPLTSTCKKKTMTMLHLKTISNESIMLKKDDIILIKSYGNEKTKIFLRGVNEVLMIDASFEEVKFAINNDLQDLQDLQGMQAVSAPLKIVT